MKRLERIRQNKLIRDLCSESGLNRSQLIQPLFVIEGLKGEEEIPALKGTKRQDIESVIKQVEKDLENGVTHFILFNVPAQKGSKDFKHDFESNVISSIKKEFGDSLYLWVDTCLCSQTDHGHCCVFNSEGRRDSKQTLKELSKEALEFVQAGANGISPSDMADGRVKEIREKLDKSGYDMTPIMSYSTKFSSHFYGPFRHAADSAPQFGDRKQYQIDVRNRTDAIESSLRCAKEGADLLMIKPGMTAIDLIKPIHEKTNKQVGAYQVSGEYGSIALLAEKGLVDFDSALLETWHVFKQAGAQYIITYGSRYAKDLGVAES